MNEDDFMEEVLKAVGAAPVLTNITKKWMRGSRPLWDLMPNLTFRQELNGEIVDEQGIDLSEVPICVRCSLEMADRIQHELWHQQEDNTLKKLQEKVDSLEATIKSLLQNVTKATEPMQPITADPNGAMYPPMPPPRPRWISDQEIRKYGSKNPYRDPPNYKSGDKWDQ